jgi:hypothetical protein
MWAGSPAGINHNLRKRQGRRCLPRQATALKITMSASINLDNGTATGLRAHDARPRACRFFQPLPEWIEADDGWADLDATERYAVRIISWRCDKPKPGDHGNLRNCRGGPQLWIDIGVSKATFWRTIKKPLQYGFVVKVRRGHGGRAGEKSEGNGYSIPGFKGALDGDRVVENREDNAPQDEARKNVGSQSDSDRASECEETRLKLRLIAPQHDALPNPPTPLPHPPHPAEDVVGGLIVIGFAAERAKALVAKHPDQHLRDVIEVLRLSDPKTVKNAPGLVVHLLKDPDALDSRLVELRKEANAQQTAADRKRQAAESIDKQRQERRRSTEDQRRRDAAIDAVISNQTADDLLRRWDAVESSPSYAALPPTMRPSRDKVPSKCLQFRFVVEEELVMTNRLPPREEDAGSKAIRPTVTLNQPTPTAIDTLTRELLNAA